MCLLNKLLQTDEWHSLRVDHWPNWRKSRLNWLIRFKILSSPVTPSLKKSSIEIYMLCVYHIIFNHISSKGKWTSNRMCTIEQKKQVSMYMYTCTLLFFHHKIVTDTDSNQNSYLWHSILYRHFHDAETRLCPLVSISKRLNEQANKRMNKRKNKQTLK